MKITTPSAQTNNSVATFLQYFTQEKVQKSLPKNCLREGFLHHPKYTALDITGPLLFFLRWTQKLT